MAVLFRFFQRKPDVAVLLLLPILCAVLFRVVWPGDQTLLAQDATVSLMALYRAELPAAFTQGFWRAMPLLGRAGHTPPTLTFALLSLLPVELFFDWIYAFFLFSGTLALYGLLRGRSFSPVAAGVGGLTAFWLGSNLTLLYPGHLEKFAVVSLASFTLWGLEAFFRKPDLRIALATGGCAGMMFLHQADLALFFSLPLGARALFLLLQPPCHPRRTVLLRGLPALIPFLLLTVQAYRFSIAAHVRDVAVLESSDPADRWDFLTQWSFPPAESLSLIAPGFHGWRSDHPDAPYHGRTGEGPDFPNLKLESVYLGLLPIALALFAALAPRPQDKGWSRFWSLTALLALLLAFGRFTPLYRLFVRLPLMDTIRNPNKFLQVFQWAVALLAATGVEAFRSAPLQRRRLSLQLLTAAALAMLLGAFLLSPRDPALLLPWTESPWADFAPGILRNRRLALFHGGLAALLGAALLHRPRFTPLLLLLLAAESLLLGRHYLQPFSTRLIRENALAETLRREIGPDRVAVSDPDSYAFFVHHVFPYHHLAAVNLTSAPRLPGDLHQWLETHGYNTPRMWRDFGVRFVLMPREVFATLSADAAVERFAFDLVELPDGDIRLQSAPGSGAHVLAHLPQFPGRFSLDAGQLRRVQQDQQGFTLDLHLPESGGTLRLADRFDPRIQARLLPDGPDLTPERSDGLFLAVPLPPGEHRLRLQIAPPDLWIRLQLAGAVLWLGALISLLPLLANPFKDSSHAHPAA